MNVNAEKVNVNDKKVTPFTNPRFDGERYKDTMMCTR